MPGVEHRTELVFLALILSQTAHSVEERVTRLYEVFAPARFVSGLFGADHATGFIILNAALVLFGFWCWAVPVRGRWRSARSLIWFWAILELANGTSHSLLALANGGYFPGVATAPLLLVFGAWLALRLTRVPARAAE